MRPLLIALILCTLQTTSAQVYLIPQPLQLTYNPGYFSVPKPLSYFSNSRDSFAFNPLKENILLEAMAYNRPGNKKQAALVCQIIPSKNWEPELKKALLDPTFNSDSEGYVLQITPKQIKLLAQTETGMFYGIQTLVQIIKSVGTNMSLPCLTIYDKPDFAIRGWQDDISRGPIPNLDFLKNEIKIMAGYKLNYFTLYTEHVFKYHSHPDIAPENGISREEIEELIAYAKQYHVTLIGNQQSFGHMEKIIAKPAYASLGEKQHILSPANEGSYKLLEDMYNEIAPAYASEYFNINCDETFGLGEEQSKAMADSMGLPNLYAYHINRLNRLLKKHHKRILMWADIAGNHPEIIPQLPKDIILLPWAYDAAENFDAMLEPIAKSGHEFWVAPGVSCWSNTFPNTFAAQKNIFNLIRDGKKHGANGVLNTTWDDDGSNFFSNNWQGLIWGAALSWNAPKGYKDKANWPNEMEQTWTAFNKSYDQQFWGTKQGSISAVQNELGALHQSKIKNLLRYKRFFEPIFPMYPDYVSREQRDENKLMETKLNDLLNNLNEQSGNEILNSNYIPYMQYAIEQSLFIVQKNEFRFKLNDYIVYDLDKYKLKSELNNLVAKLTQLENGYGQLYNQESRNWWLKENLERFDKLKLELEQLQGMCLIMPDSVLTRNKRKITLKSLIYDLPIYYTTDGSTPGSKAKLYKKPFFINKTTTLKTTLFFGTPPTVTKDSLVQHKAIGKIINFNPSYSRTQPSFEGGGKMGLTDGRVGSADNLKSGYWQGYSGKDIELYLDFGKKKKLRNFEMGFYQHTTSWVILPKEIEIYISKDGTNFTLYKTITHPVEPNSGKKIKYVFETDLDKIKTRYMKIIAKNYGKLPSWHASPGNDSMLFADEVIVR